ncbi:oxalate decarboxylase/phosphoglucose isomerase-like protein (cupin superfamily) [Paenibacillus sp. DS2015]|uniref:cupin domain-containing protein n=1 Tax=Paenibacillus sp. DS2015 TaxID=3373917 RepID=UPI003D1A79BE
MAVSYMDFTSPNTQFSYDVSSNRFFTKDSGNYINALGIQQLNTLGNNSILDIFLTKGNVVEPHVHQNASELVYCVTGAAVVSLINPFTKEVRNFPITPRQVANVPQGWFHWEIATENNTHLIAIFDAPVPEFIAVSDFLRLAPTNILAHTYCLDEAKLKETLAPITSTTTIGPPANCPQYHQPQPYAQGENTSHQAPHSHTHNPYTQSYGSPAQSYNRDRPRPTIGNLNRNPNINE